MKYKLHFGPVDKEHEPLAFIPLITYWVRRFSNNFVYLQLSSFHLKTTIFVFLEKTCNFVTLVSLLKIQLGNFCIKLD